MGDDEITITYETLFEILVREKGRDELQKLEETFFDDVVNYIEEKKVILEKNRHKSIFSEDESVAVMTQLKNIKSIINELYDRRERKVLNMAINKARTKSGLINTSALLVEENNLFEELTLILSNYRHKHLDKLFNSNGHQSTEKLVEKTVEPPVKESDLKHEGSKADVMKVKFVTEVSKFAGTNLEEYGPFKPEDVVEVPEQIANILINSKKAVSAK